MKTSSDKPTITDKFHIEVPTHEYYSNYAVYKIWFGKKFFIWKGKSMLQSVQLIATLIDRKLRMGNDDKTDFIFHCVSYIKKARVTRAYIEIVDIADFDDTDWLKFLKAEQNLLTAHKNDEDCLNNNFTVYVPQWMGKETKIAFEKWMNERGNIKKKNKGVRA